MLKRIFFFLTALYITGAVAAQVFGGNPASLKWKQLNTDTLRIIFPEGMEQSSQRIANLLQRYQQITPHTIGNRIRKVSIVLQNLGIQSNGYVSLAPYRSEFYTTPPQNPFELGAVRWTDYLALHEFRHVQQFSNFNRGLSKLATFLLGEQGQLVANAAAVPNWFFEGDAVYNETKYTRQGRGRLPSFFNGYRSLFQADKKYAYQKLRNGSFRDYLPDHYQLGYLLVAYGREKYGEDIWQKITADAVAFKPLFYPFQGAIEKNTGLPFRKFVDDAFRFYQTQWQNEGVENAAWISATEKNNVVDYEYPELTEDGRLLVVKSSRREIPAFYVMDTLGKSHKIATRAISGDYYFSSNGKKIVYTASQPDPRWGNRMLQSIRILDINTGEETFFPKNGRWFSPDIIKDGNQLLAVEVATDGSSRIELFTEKGELQKEISVPGIFFSHPKFSKEGQGVFVAARNDRGEMSLLKYDWASGRADTLVYPSNQLIGFLSVQGDTVLFSKSHEGRDEIWGVIDQQNRKGPYRLASYPTGIYRAVLLPGNKLAASVFTAEGYRIASFIPQWERMAQKDELNATYTPQLKNNFLDFAAGIPQRNFKEEKYAKFSGLFNFHSYRPYYEQPEYSFTIYGQNLLNTFQSQLAYTYNENENSHKAGFNAVYGGSYIQPLLGISNTWHRSAVLNKDTAVHWNELEWYTGLQLPLNFSSGKRYRFLTVSSTYRSDKLSWTGIGQKLFTNRDFGYLQSRISFSSQTQQAQQQIFPHFAESVLLQYRNSIGNYKASQFLASGSLYLPGFSGNHSLVINAAFQARDTMLQYIFTNNFPFARGYQSVDFPRMWKLGVNYHFPVAYPDWGLGQIVYFLRVRAAAFFDYATGKSLRTGIATPFRTAGMEWYFDTRWWNQQPVTFGFRYSRLLDNELRGITRPDIWEFIMPVNLF